jgi:DNA mismatch repair protein MutS2
VNYLIIGDDYMLDSNIPTIDLHGETRDTARILVNEFISDNIKLGNKKLNIIHGIGTGILKKEVHDFLKKDKRVDKYYVDFFNVGSTIVIIK